MTLGELFTRIRYEMGPRTNAAALAGIVAPLVFGPGEAAFYFFLFLSLAWIEVMALRLRAVTADTPAGRTAPAS